MPNDYYPEPDGPDESMPPPKEEDMDKSEGKTALLPKSVLGGKEFKVGEEVVLKVTHIYEDEVAVEYASEKPAEEGADELAGDEEFDMMDKGNMMTKGGMNEGY